MLMTVQTWSRRLAVTMLVTALTLGLSPKMAMACSQCFGSKVNNATTFGITMSMLALLGFLGVVWGGIGLFVWRVRKRSQMLEPDDWVVTEDGNIRPLDD